MKFKRIYHNKKTSTRQSYLDLNPQAYKLKLLFDVRG